MSATVHVLRQIDVGDSVHLEQVTHILEKREVSRGTTVLRSPDGSAIQGVVLRNEPVDLKLGRVEVGALEADARVRLFEFGVVAFRFTFAAPDPSSSAIVNLSAQLVRDSALFDRKANELWQDLGRQIRAAVVPWEDGAAAELMEDFTVFVLPTPFEGDASDRTLAHVLLGEPASRKLSTSLVNEISRRVIRYYEDDLVLVDYDAAVVVDRVDLAGGPKAAPGNTTEETANVVDIFEIASAQLLELRFYDVMLGRALEGLLADVRRARTAAWFFRSPFRRLARRTAVLALELGELGDRLERAITLVGDTYSAQIYRETALRFRLAESGASVREKVEMIGRIAEVLGHEIHSRRDLVLEILIIVLILFEVVVAFRP